MKIEIRGSGIVASAGVREYAERRMQFALGRFASRLPRVMVEIGDANGPRGGIDMYCRVVADVARHPLVVAEATESDLRAAIDRAADRVSRAVGREIDRARTSRRAAADGKEAMTRLS